MDRSLIWNSYGKGHIDDVKHGYKLAYGGQLSSYSPAGPSPRTRGLSVSFDHQTNRDGSRYTPSALSSRDGDGSAGPSPPRARPNPDRSTIWRNYGHGHISNIQEGYKVANPGDTHGYASAQITPRQREPQPPRSRSSLDHMPPGQGAMYDGLAPGGPEPGLNLPRGEQRGDSRASSRYSRGSPSRNGEATNPLAWRYPGPKPGQLEFLRETSLPPQGGGGSAQRTAGSDGGYVSARAGGTPAPAGGAARSLRDSGESFGGSAFSSWYPSGGRLNEPPVHSPSAWQSTAHEHFVQRPQPGGYGYSGYGHRDALRRSGDSGRSSLYSASSLRPPSFLAASEWRTSNQDQYPPPAARMRYRQYAQQQPPASSGDGSMRHGVEGTLAQVARLPRRPVFSLPITTTTHATYIDPQERPPMRAPAHGKAGAYGPLLSLPGRANPYYNQDLAQMGGGWGGRGSSSGM